MQEISGLTVQERAETPRFRQQVERRLPQQTLDELVARYLAGLPTPQLCREYHLGKSTVLRLLRDRGVQMRRQGLSPEQLPRAVQLYESGWSLVRVAGQLGVSARHAQDRPRGAGVVMRDSHGRVR